MLPHSIASVPLDALHPYEARHERVYVVPTMSETAQAPAPTPVDGALAVASHAWDAATCHVSVLGDHALAMARVLTSTLDVELRLLGTPKQEPSPVRFTFPAPIVAHVGLWEDALSSDLYLLVVTVTGFVYRLRIPVACVLRGTALPSTWALEHAVEHMSESVAPTATSVHVIDAGLLLISCADGALIRLQLWHGAEHGPHGAWHESVMRPSSFLLSRLFRGGATPDGVAPTQTLSVACHIRDTDTALVFCVCRDRKVRVWNLATDTLVRTLDLPSTSQAESTFFEHGSTPLVQLLYPDDSIYSFYVVLYVPDTQACLAAYGVELEESRSWSGGLGEMALVWTRPCDPMTQAPDVELRDMALVRHRETWRVWLLWHAAGAPLLQTTIVSGSPTLEAGAAPLVLGDTEEPWRSIQPWSPYAPLHGPALDAALAEHTDAPAPFFLARLCEPMRFSATTLAAALRAEGVEVESTPTHPRLAAAMASTLGSHVDAWLRFTRRVEQLDRAARWPLHLYVRGGVPWIVTRHALGVAEPTGAGAWLAQVAQRWAAAAPFTDRPSAQWAVEAAQAEYVQVQRLCATQAPDDEAYALLQTRGQSHPMALLDVATWAAEAVYTLGTRAARKIDAALQPSSSLSALAALRLPSDLLARLAAMVEREGADVWVSHVAQAVAVYTQAPTPTAWLAATQAYTLLASLHVRLQGLRGLLVLLAHVTPVPALASVQAQAYASWKEARARYVLASTWEDHVGTLSVLHAALGRGVAHDASVPVLAHSVLDVAPHAVRACLATWDDATSTYLRMRANAHTGRAKAAYQECVRLSARMQAGVQEHAWDVVVPPACRASATPTAQFSLWRFAATWLESDVYVSYQCYQQAMHALERGADVPEAEAREVWTMLFRAQLALHLYDEASSTILALPWDDLRTTCLSSLVTTLCQSHEVRTLLRLDLLEWQPHVERTLSFQARHATPWAEPSYFHILYAYHVSRGDYKSAAASMYQHAHRIGEHMHDAPNEADSAQHWLVTQAQSYLATINALTLLPPSQAWFAHATDQAGEEVHAQGPHRALRGTVTKFIPLTEQSAPLAIVQLDDVRHAYQALLTRLSLMRTYPELALPHTPLRADDAMHLMLANDDVDHAFTTARQLSLPMDSLFDALTQTSVQLQRSYLRRVERVQKKESDPSLQTLRLDDEEAADPHAAFLRRSPRAAHWAGPAHERAWKYVHMHWTMTTGQAHTTYARVIAERLLAMDAWSMAPSWLTTFFDTQAPDVLLRVMMRAGKLEQALEYSASCVQRATDEARTSSSTQGLALPYSLMDSLLYAAESQPHLEQAREALQARLAKRMEALRARSQTRRA